MKLKFLEIGTSVKTKLNEFFSTLSQRRCRREPALELEDACIEEEEEEKEEEEEQDVLTRFLQTRKNQLMDLQDHLERYCNVLPVFGFNTAKYDISLLKRYLLPLPIIERGIEPIVIKKANQFFYKFGDVQLLDILNFLGGATRFDSFWKAYKTSETKRYFPYEWFNDPGKLNNIEFPPYKTFF